MCPTAGMSCEQLKKSGFLPPLLPWDLKEIPNHPRFQFPLFAGNNASLQPHVVARLKADPGDLL